MTDVAAVRDALAGVQSAFDEASRRRVGFARVLARTSVGPHSEGARRTFVEAVLRREAADNAGDVAAVKREEAAARDARAQLEAAGETEAVAIADSIDATWPWAFGVADRLARGLEGRAPADIVEALRAYVGALRTDDAQGAGAAATALETAVRRAFAEKP